MYHPRYLDLAAAIALARAMATDDPLLRPGQAAAYLGQSVQQLTAWRRKRVGPSWIELPPVDGSPIRYRTSTLDIFMLDSATYIPWLCARDTRSKAQPGDKNRAKASPVSRRCVTG